MDVSNYKYCLRSTASGTMCYPCYNNLFRNAPIVYDHLSLDELRVFEVAMIANVKKATEALHNIQHIMHEKEKEIKK